MQGLGLDRLRRPRPRIPRPGDFLVASPSLQDPNFRRTLIYMLQHDDEGSAGVIVNRSSDISSRDLDVPVWALAARVRNGGPVATNSILALAEDIDGVPLPDELGGPGVRLIDLEKDEEPPSSRQLQIFVGYAGWGAGQLLSEITRDDWHVVAGQPQDLFAPQPEVLWSQVLRRQPDPTRLWSTLPELPATN